MAKKKVKDETQQESVQSVMSRKNGNPGIAMYGITGI